MHSGSWLGHSQLKHFSVFSLIMIAVFFLLINRSFRIKVVRSNHASESNMAIVAVTLVADPAVSSFTPLHNGTILNISSLLLLT